MEYLSETVPGSIHDKKLADAAPYPLPEGSVLMQDLGFLGLKREDVDVKTPQKKPKGKELTDAQRESNRNLSRHRVRVEHVISSIKRLNILSSPRGFSDASHSLFMKIACGLHNYRVATSDTWRPMSCPI